MANESLTVGDLCNEADAIYKDFLQRHAKQTTKQTSPEERDKQAFIDHILMLITEIQAWALYAALLKKERIAAHVPVPFNQNVLLAHEELYQNVVLGDGPSRTIFLDIYKLRKLVEEQTIHW